MKNKSFIKRLIVTPLIVILALTVISTSLVCNSEKTESKSEETVEVVKVEKNSAEPVSDLITCVEIVEPTEKDENIVKQEVYTVNQEKIEKSTEKLNDAEKEAIETFEEFVKTGSYEDKITGLVYQCKSDKDNNLEVKILTKDGKVLATLNLSASIDADVKAIVEYISESEEFKELEDEARKFIEKLVFGITREEHYSRNEEHGNLIENFEGIVDKDGYVNQEYIEENNWDDSVSANCHQFNSEDRSNIKYVSEDGQYEFIFDKDGKVVLDDENVGTYNYYDSRDGVSGVLGHARTDVITWIVWGNTAEDTTTPLQRALSLVGVYVD